ncbi:MAG: NAD(+)/NADH kinase [Opitutaceae bacterium]
MPPIRKIAFIVNDEKKGAPGLVRDLMAQARAAHVPARLTRRFPPRANFLRGVDACCVIGGDGTLLGVAREAALAKVPIIGVNCGTLGFLTTFSAEEARASFPALLRGGFRIESRTMLKCAADPSGRTDLALNDVLVRTTNSRLVRLEVLADGELVTESVCDGLIFSTATGSTAYNLSAGGPIIHPSAAVIAMTPICPHTLSNRTIVFRDGVRLRVRNRTPGSSVLISMDGQRNWTVRGDEPVRISAARIRLRLAQREDYAHFSVVRAKLSWNDGLIRA